jgi:FAD/FMN-containing dehydrogenase
MRVPSTCLMPSSVRSEPDGAEADRRPALIARCQNTADVADAVRFARAEGLDICVRGGGHNVAGRAVVDGALMIDLAPMKGIHVARAGNVGAQV